MGCTNAKPIAPAPTSSDPRAGHVADAKTTRQHATTTNINNNDNKHQHTHQQHIGTRTRESIRRPAVSAEPTGHQRYADDKAPPPLRRAPDVPKKPSEVVERILRAVGANPLFNDLSPSLLAGIVEAMEERSVAEDEQIIAEGDPGDHFYVVDSGHFEVFISQVGPDPVQELGPGSTFGELALMYNKPRAATVKCTTAAKVYSLERRTFRELVQESGTATKSGLQSFLADIPALKELETSQIVRLADAAEEARFVDGEPIISIGETADALYVVLSGEVRCHKDGAELMRLGTGKFFGESAVSQEHDAIRQANVVAVGDVRVAKLKAAAFASQLGSLAEVMQRNFNAKVLGSVALLAGSLDDAQMEDLLDAFEERLFAEGETIVKQGEPGSNFYIIKRGSASVDVDGEQVTVLESAQYFGERSLLADAPVSATVTAKSKLAAMTLTKAKFEALLGRSLQAIVDAETKRRELAEETRAERAKIRWDDLEVLQVLGEGSFGRVKLTRHRPTGAVYALKCFRKGQLIKYMQLEHVIAEKRVLNQCDHPFILSLVSSFNDREQIYFLTEILPGGELFTILRRADKFPEHQARLYAAMVTSAFGYLHSRKIAHRDLKPENLMFDADGYVKLIDMGFAKVIKERTWTLCGTPEYLCPEIISSKGHGCPVDWWCLGILLFEMLAGHPPYFADTDIETYQKIMRGKLKFPDTFCESAKPLIMGLLTHSQSQRLGSGRHGTRDVMGARFFSEVDWRALEERRIPMPYVPPIKNDLDTSQFDAFPDDDNSSWDIHLDASLEPTWEKEFGST